MDTSNDAMPDVKTSRLVQYSFSQAIEECYGNECIDKIAYNAGEIAGNTFFNWYLKKIASLEMLIGTIKAPMKEFGIKTLNVDDIYIENETVVLVLTAALYSQEMTSNPISSFKYEEGFIAAFLNTFTGRLFKVSVIEVENAYEANCRFQAEMI